MRNSVEKYRAQSPYVNIDKKWVKDVQKWQNSGMTEVRLNSGAGWRDVPN